MEIWNSGGGPGMKEQGLGQGVCEGASGRACSAAVTLDPRV